MSRQTLIIAAAVVLVLVAAVIGYVVSGPSGGAAALSEDQAVVTTENQEGGALKVVDMSTGAAHEVVSTDASRPTVSPDRLSIIYLRTITGTDREARVMDADGGDDHALFPSDHTCAQSTRPAWSSDGNQLAVICIGGGAEPTLWTSNADGGSLQLIDIDTSSRGVYGRLAGSPAWAPYGDQSGIVLGVRSAADETIDLVWVNPGDPSDWHPVTYSTGADYDPDWSQETGKLLFQRNINGTQSVGGSPMTIDSLDDISPSPLLDGEGYGSGAWSPDGSEVALPRTEDHTLMRVDGGGGTPSEVPDFGDGVYSLAWGTR